MTHTESSNLNNSKLSNSCFLLFCAHGLVFSSWASRIPIIKDVLSINEAELGTLLLLMPIGQLSTMVLAGKLISIHGSSWIIKKCFLLYPVFLLLIGISPSYWTLAIVLFFFGVTGNLCNIAMNTQAIEIETITKRTLLSSCHGAWCLAGLVGALIGLLMININISTFYHFVIVFILVLLLWLYSKSNLTNIAHKTERQKQSIFKSVNPTLVALGFTGFLSMAIEGAMFDWSGVYFQTIVKAPENLIILGYTSFVLMMTLGRFVGNRVIERYGKKTVLQSCGILMSSGLFLSVLFPELWVCIIAFMIIGLGGSLSVPSIYSTVGQVSKVAPSIALSFVSSISFLGFLIGPPLIGYIAEAFDLRYSYGVFACFGILLTAIVSQMKVFKN
ncbi:MFS transporter [Elizabethkingia meningoseptica]|uniref:MFS transporter n=1 Tax=Elizabethkingia meningoseptica TaxID=238 RepID=UPI000332CE62|nr:MFS transporter [Elizabethkingia meningoseptica]AQX06283.1 MFS transporter [Elizabethkingia meningoseptica]AQX48332.1 MFS transporter [Elizabethkingia meningoseptica]EOR28316.1 major facilitator superfamily protein [Elizabethkingia meningoseptica ATCC 13253 = NBRC 12535]KUY16417.1 MFS transporter [Elizabethkingia meningoseptica]MDE5487826.1 MFS transporter [Elizabethkingia meningoseptica]